MASEEENRRPERLCPRGKCANSRQTLRVAINLKTLIDQVVPTTLHEKEITDSHSPVLNRNVIELVYRAAGGAGDGKKGTTSYKYRSCLVFSLLKVTGWYWQQAEYELSDNELYSLRATAAQTLAAILIEEARDDEFLFLAMLCHRYLMHVCEKDSSPVSALELAVDMHSTIVIGSSGYQRCIKWLWRGWIVQSSEDPQSYVLYRGVSSSRIWIHFNPERIKTPAYQNKLEIIVSFLYLTLYTFILNTNQVETSPVNIAEGIFYVFTLGAILDELTKLYHVGLNYIGFWNVFNDTMYGIISVAIAFRFVSLSNHGRVRDHYDEMSFRILSCAAPLMWSRLLLYLDAQQFVGAMLVVIKTMMKESILFFVLFAVVILGFLQGFLGLDASDGKSEATKKILASLINAVIGEAGLKDVLDLVPPYASVLYYIYSFVLTVILMNILIALYSTSYAAIVENATDEYFALVAQKTLRYIRAPDSNLYVPPFNLIETLFMPLSYIISASNYKILNHYTMLILYSPMLMYITVDELSNAKRIQYNRFRGVADDANEINTEWDLTDGFDDDIDGSGWENIRNHSVEVNRVVQNQRAAEAEDPEFSIDLDEFHRDIQKLAQPVMKASDMGIKWELFGLYQKIEELTSLVSAVVEENKVLREKASGEGKDSAT
ncbi:hypothetical protein METBIDRAFT_77267 [Metschnikowia bicuspidata var. bicuspidata NRRL YB-4993]|uniref:Vacuolar cation channel n=1 Tax=Metschnikowia bicuspidata var. bicuspidata NRRL YB-4993 TaxID=869754 RepID=A0A1A0HKD2_9ASCO|nr:hypothetical protein METBIDRAFT_77267 [Metschnikowia bicuspidata var. bicuspidata NRRL YB-4993]OBA24480.1 hypothetical protein METBIDRAFT_77267 [Metschnikowia bicuspidata var. bicuspidata NRRL YB-4993]